MKLPYPDLPTLDLGPVSISAFGVLLLGGIVLGEWAARKRAAQLDVSPRTVQSAAFTVVLVGLVSAHVFDLVVYQRVWSLRALLDLRTGLSSIHP